MLRIEAGRFDPWKMGFDKPAVGFRPFAVKQPAIWGLRRVATRQGT
jgi:hypothetical protein